MSRSNGAAAKERDKLVNEAKALGWVDTLCLRASDIAKVTSGTLLRKSYQFPCLIL